MAWFHTWPITESLTSLFSSWENSRHGQVNFNCVKGHISCIQQAQVSVAQAGPVLNSCLETCHSNHSVVEMFWNFAPQNLAFGQRRVPRLSLMAATCEMYRLQMLTSWPIDTASFPYESVWKKPVTICIDFPRKHYYHGIKVYKTNITLPWSTTIAQSGVTLTWHLHEVSVTKPLTKNKVVMMFLMVMFERTEHMSAFRAAV